MAILPPPESWWGGLARRRTWWSAWGLGTRRSASVARSRVLAQPGTRDPSRWRCLACSSVGEGGKPVRQIWLLLLLAGSAAVPAHAQTPSAPTESPRRFALEIKFAPYVPAI